MKKIFLLTMAVSTASLFASAQISRGSTMLGGEINFNSQQSEQAGTVSNKQSHVYVNPSLGFAVRENMVLGFGLSYSRVSNAYLGNPGYKSRGNSYGASTFLRKYVPVRKSLYFFGEGDLGYSYSKGFTEGTSSEGTSKGWHTGLSGTAGISYALTRKMHVETSIQNLLHIGYSRGTSRSGGSTTDVVSKSFSAGSSLNNFTGFDNLNFGFRFFL